MLTKETSDGTTSYYWSARNKQKEVILPDGGTNFYSYYPESDLRFAVTDANNEETRYFYEGSNVTEELNQYNYTNVSYIEGLGVDDHIARVENGNTYGYLSDPLGTVRNVVDGSGSVVNTYDYRAYGETRRKIEAVDNAYLFTGRRFDNDTGEYYFRARYYNSATGRFGAVDRYVPYEMAFAYGGANPVMMVDPLGLYRISNKIKEHPTDQTRVGRQVSIGYQIDIKNAQNRAIKSIKKFLESTNDDLCKEFPSATNVNLKKIKSIFNKILSGLEDNNKWISYSTPNILTLSMFGCSPNVSKPDALAANTGLFPVSAGTILIFDKALGANAKSPLDSTIVHEAWHETSGSKGHSDGRTVDDFSDLIDKADDVEDLYTKFLR